MASPLSANGNAWHVIHTKSRREKKLHDECLRIGLLAYLPLIKNISVYRRKIFESTKPLFPGYVFCCFDRAQRKDLYQTGHVAKLISVVDQEGLMRDLIEIEKAISIEASLEPYTYLKRGTRARIVDGPFQGIEGIISHRRGKYRLVMNVNLIEMAAAIEVNACQIEPLNIRTTPGSG
jgi:transcription antitermination factor NusG